MPVAVVVLEPVHKDLKSCPPDGYVKIKRMTFGEKQQRRSFNSKMTMKAQKGSKDVNTEVEMFNTQAELFDFKVAIVDHNLQDVDGRPLNFTNPEDVKKLDGRIAEEIGKYIDEINNFEDEEEVGK